MGESNIQCVASIIQNLMFIHNFGWFGSAPEYYICARPTFTGIGYIVSSIWVEYLRR